jgi:hypothetical protein
MSEAPQHDGQTVNLRDHWVEASKIANAISAVIPPDTNRITGLVVIGQMLGMQVHGLPPQVFQDFAQIVFATAQVMRQAPTGTLTEQPPG